MRTCPKCGAVSGDDDLFCEADGTVLAAPPTAKRSEPPAERMGMTRRVNTGARAKPAPTKVAAASGCGSCGAANSDDGDGYCSACGHRLLSASASPPTAPFIREGAVVGGFSVKRVLAVDAALAEDSKGMPVRLIAGDALALAAEATASERATTSRLARFPRLVSRGAEHGIAWLALSHDVALAALDRDESRSLTDVLAIAEGAIAIAAELEGVGLDIAPLPGDFAISSKGEIGLTRLRGARSREPGAAIDAKRIVEAAGASCLPGPASAGPTRLVRLLAPNLTTEALEARSVAACRSELAEVRREIAAAPAPIVDLAELADPGMWRSYQQDATAIASGETGGEAWRVLVLCDGVSSSPHSGPAATVAAHACRDALAHFARSGDIAREAPAGAVAAAIKAAHLAICGEFAAAPVPELPGATIVAALVHRGRLTVGWLGDSRAYLVGAHAAEQLTLDHSWVNEALARGEIHSAAEADDKLAHTITKCIGPLEVGEAVVEVLPEVKSRGLAGRGVLVLASDGFWNYADDAAAVAAIVGAQTNLGDARALAQRLVNYALASGGHDNVSVAIHCIT